MGRFAFTLVAGVLLCSGAQASSIIALEAMDEPVGPSVIVIGAPAEPAMDRQETATGTQLAYPFPGGSDGSFTAMGSSLVGLAAPISDEKVAAIGDDKEARHHFAPMVIRGGIVGDAFARTVAPRPQDTASAEAPQSMDQDAQHHAEAAPPPSELPAPR